MKSSMWLLLPALGVSALACASHPSPAQNIAITSANVGTAEQAGAASDSRAAQQLQLAKGELEHAKQLAAKGDNEGADYAAMRANADAQLSVAFARESSAMQNASQAVAIAHQAQSTTVTSGVIVVTPAKPSQPQNQQPSGPQDEPSDSATPKQH